MPKPKLHKGDIDKAVSLKKAGASDKDIADYLGVHRTTFWRWCTEPKTENQRNLCNALKKAEAERKAKLLTMIYNAATDPKKWQAAAWLLERQYPEEYAQSRRDLKAEEKADEAPMFYFDPGDMDG